MGREWRRFLGKIPQPFLYKPWHLLTKSRLNKLSLFSLGHKQLRKDFILAYNPSNGHYISLSINYSLLVFCIIFFVTYMATETGVSLSNLSNFFIYDYYNLIFFIYDYYNLIDKFGRHYMRVYNLLPSVKG